MIHKYKVGDVITITGGRHKLPAPIVALGVSHDTPQRPGYIVLKEDGWPPSNNYLDLFYLRKDFEKFRDNSPGARFSFIFEYLILEVQSSIIESNRIDKTPTITGEKTLYDLMRAELRERIQKEEAQRPANAAFEFL